MWAEAEAFVDVSGDRANPDEAFLATLLVDDTEVDAEEGVAPFV
jgi:hypothetical protein